MTDTNQETVKGAELQLVELVEKELYFSEGLLGFPNCQRYKFTRFDPGDGSDSPFFILESTEHNLSFTLIHPDFVAPDY
jgi:flagellar assembly factor FliW